MAPLLHIVYEPKFSEADIDIIFVHGLNPINVENHAYRTWTHPNGVCWPVDFLPEALPQARIMVFGYNSNVATNAYAASMRGHAAALLNLLSHRRMLIARPVFFVCHSLGGLVVKQALIQASLDSKTNGKLKDDTLGIACFGTPHRGRNGTSIWKVAENIVTAITGQAENTSLNTFTKEALILENITSDFHAQLEDYYFISFFETQKMKRPGALTGFWKMKVVDAESATLGLSSQREQRIALDANHSKMCKYASKDETFLIVIGAFKSIVERSLKEYRRRREMDETGAAKIGSDTIVSLDAARSDSKPNKHPISDTSKIYAIQKAHEPSNARVYAEEESLHKVHDTELETPSSPSRGGTSSVNPPVPKCGLSSSAPTRDDELLDCKSETKGTAASGNGHHEAAVKLAKTKRASSDTFLPPLQAPLSPDDTPVRLIISGLGKVDEQSKRHSLQLEVVAGLNTRVDEVIQVLLEHGFDYIEGFYCAQTGVARGSMAHRSIPFHIFVTDQPSCYEFEKGFFINSSETFGSFYKTLITRPFDIDVRRNEISISRGSSWSSTKTKIRFMRTLRIPDDGKDYNLPAGFQPFQLFDSLQFHKTLPLDMHAKGGVLLPMLQHEAMYMEFSGDWLGHSYAVRIRAGGVNAVTGKPWRSEEPISVPPRQDYIVIPSQERLFGILIDSDRVQQFVAMPRGIEYSGENEVAGSGYFGGLQLEIIPRHVRIEEELKDLHDLLRISLPEAISVKRKVEQPATPSKSPKQLGLLPGDVVLFSAGKDGGLRTGLGIPVHDNEGPCMGLDMGSRACLRTREQVCRPTVIWEFFHDLPTPGSAIELTALHDPISVRMTSLRKDQEQDPILLRCSPFLDLNSLAAAAMDRMDVTLCHMALSLNGKVLEEPYSQLYDIGIWNGANVEMNFFDFSILTPSPPTHWHAPTRSHFRTKTDAWDMTLTPSGKIKQNIHVDAAPEEWDYSQARALNIQALDSVAFEAVTGLKCPKSPITAEHYLDFKIPFRQYTEQEIPKLNSQAPQL